MYYSFIPVVLLVVGLYIASYLLSRFRVLRLSDHHRIWNLLLILTFIISCGLGLVLQWENAYDVKLVWPFNIKYWHVEISLAMSIIAVCHASWHWRYLLKIFDYSRSIPVEDPLPSKSENQK
jgi:hypothetical protein